MNSGKLIPKKIEFTTLRRSTEVKLRIIVDVRGVWSYSTALFIESPPSAQLLSISEGKQEDVYRDEQENTGRRTGRLIGRLTGRRRMQQTERLTERLTGRR